MRYALIFHLQDDDSIPLARGIDSYVDALRESEGEEFYLTHLSVASLREQDRARLGI